MFQWKTVDYMDCKHFSEYRKLLLASLRLTNFGVKPLRRHIFRNFRSASSLRVL